MSKYILIALLRVSLSLSLPLALPTIGRLVLEDPEYGEHERERERERDRRVKENPNETVGSKAPLRSAATLGTM